jgi:hypothetical protein
MDSSSPVHAETKALSASAVADTRSIALTLSQIEKSQDSGIRVRGIAPPDQRPTSSRAKKWATR